MARSLSVLIPVLRAPVYVEQCLSALEHALRDYAGEVEIIIVRVSYHAANSNAHLTTSPLRLRSFSSFSVSIVEGSAPDAGRAWISTQATSQQCHGCDTVQNCTGASFCDCFSPAACPSTSHHSAAPVSGALNAAAHTARGELLLLLSESAEPSDGLVEALSEALVTPAVAIVGAMLRDRCDAAASFASAGHVAGKPRRGFAPLAVAVDAAGPASVAGLASSVVRT
eukprot:6198469-Pleurochrysis_carterae.AAC.1